MEAKKRKVVMMGGDGRIVVEREPIPELQAGRVLVRVADCLISPGTELGGVKKRREKPNSDVQPRPFGYGNAGSVIESGQGAEDILPGTRLACMGGGYALHATHASVPRNLTEPIPGEVSFEEASFAHLAATALHAVRRAELQLGEHALVMGLGLVGQLCMRLSYLAGGHVLGVDRYPMRTKIAQDAGLQAAALSEDLDLVDLTQELSRGHGFDCVFIAFGGDATEALKMALPALKLSPDGHRMGRVVIVGGATICHPFAAGMGNVDVRSSARPGPGYHDEAWEHGANYPPVFVPWTTKRNLEACLRWIQEGRLSVKELITHRFPLDEAPEACELLVQKPDEALGVILQA